MKKKFVVAFMSLLVIGKSSMAKAGDLSVVCFTDGDTGSFVGNFPNQFINSRAGLTFKNSRNTFVVLVDRVGVLGNYEYQITKIDNVDGGYSTTKRSAKNYDTIIDINAEVQCKIID